MRKWLILAALLVAAAAVATPASAQLRQGGRVATGLIDYQNDSWDGGLNTTRLTLDFSFGYLFGPAFEGGALIDSTSTSDNRKHSSTVQLLGAYGKYHFNPARATPVYAGAMFAAVSGDSSGSLFRPVVVFQHFATASLMLILEARLLTGSIDSTNLTRVWILSG